MTNQANDHDALLHDHAHLVTLVRRAKSIIETQEAAFQTAKGAAWLQEATAALRGPVEPRAECSHSNISKWRGIDNGVIRLKCEDCGVWLAENRPTEPKADAPTHKADLALHNVCSCLHCAAGDRSR